MLILGVNFKHEIIPDYDTVYGFKNLMDLSINDCSFYGNLPKWLSKLKKFPSIASIQQSTLWVNTSMDS